MLWLSIRLPLLPLEVFPSAPPPSAIVAGERIVVADTVAARAGIQSGMRLADAWALLPELAVLARDTARERRQLAALACWAGAFTPEISLALPDALLLELQGSLRLFGGLDALLVRVAEGVAAQGHAARMAVAPTPQAALWLADDPPRRCPTPAGARQALDALPIDALEPSRAEAARLTGFGIRHLGDLLRLPRAGLARRLGPVFVDTLARALGERPDPRERYRFPERFDESIELPARIEEAGRLLFAARRLLQRLCGWLAARGSGVAACELHLLHEARPATPVSLRFAAPTRDAARMGRVLGERLGCLRLAAPVTAIALTAEHTEALPGRMPGLFGDTEMGDGVMQLVERLRARLGEESVHGLAARAGHRPECVSLPVEPGSGGAVPAAGPRPAWLLASPRALPEIDGRPRHGGPLRLLAGPERIESGWWDEGESGAPGDVQRDYFVALSVRHEWLWIFKCREGWFLHGCFA